MKRFILSVLVAASVLSFAGCGKDDSIKIGVVQLVEHPALDASYKGFVDALAANGYVDIPFILPLLTPYVGAGIGYGRLENSNVMPMQLMLGMDAEIFVIPVVGSIEYRYLQTNRPAKSAGERNKFYSHVLMLKLRYEF